MIRHLATSLMVTGLALQASPAAGGIVKGPWVQRVTPTSAVVRVEVDPAAPVTVQVAGHGAFASAETKKLHAIAVTGLEPARRVTYSVEVGGDSRMAPITTAPADDAGQAFRFVVYGDNRSDDAAHASIVRGITAVQTDFLVNTGDLVAEGGNPRDWQKFFDIEAPLLRERCLFSCIGNHELVDGAGIDFARYFGLQDVPDREGGAPLTADMLNGTFRWGSARFFLLNGNVQMRAGATREWLERVLAAADGEKGVVWRVLVVHHGPWSSGPHGGNARLVDAGIVDLLKTHGIDIVLAGHDHIYERGFEAGGIPYIVSGGGGAPTYKVTPKPYAKKFESTRHWVEASVSPVAIQFAATRLDGSVIERCGLRKDPRGWDCDAVGAPPSTPPPSSKCGCEVVGSAWPKSTSVLGVGLAAALAALARLRRTWRTRRSA